MFIIGNVYAPNNEKDQLEFFDNVYSTLLDFNDEEHPCMIGGGRGGDFNLIKDLDLDREGGTMKTTYKRSCALVEKLRNDFDLIDIWRVRNKTKKKNYMEKIQSICPIKIRFLVDLRISSI